MSVLLFVVGIGYVWNISTKKEESPAVTPAPAPSPSVVVPTPSSAPARPRVTVQTLPPKPALEPVREANTPVEPAATAREPIAVAAPAAADDKAQLARNLTSSHDTAGLNARVAIINMALADAAGSNNSEVAQVIAAGLAGDDRATYDLARSAIRNRTFAARFDDWRRLRTEARPINEETLASYRSNLAEAKQRESIAVALDPFDQEIAGNLGLYFALDGKAQLAANLAIYNLALRPQNSTGRSADWHLLATALALQGKLRDSEGAFFVGLAISTNLSGLCRSLLVQQAQFGDVLKEPITSVFRRIAERGNSATDGCAYPPVWRN